MWKQEWDALSRRIAGIMEASTFLFRTNDADWAYSTNILSDNCKRIAESVLSLLRYGDALPVRAADALARFKEWWGKTQSPSLSGYPAVQASVVLLGSIRSELDHLLADHDEIVRSHVARAFLHLQRSLVADEDMRRKWLNAFGEGETSCEQLGGVHLLLHGIWAFKVSAAGERTDLVLGTRLVVDRDVMASAHGLVLTEWKLVREGDCPEKKKGEAMHQARQYSQGSVAGFELESERYLVLVAKQEFTIPTDEIEGEKKYKVVPLVLDKSVPSISAKTAAKQ